MRAKRFETRAGWDKSSSCVKAAGAGFSEAVVSEKKRPVSGNAAFGVSGRFF
jgi:hypothetical protein